MLAVLSLAGLVAIGAQARRAGVDPAEQERYARSVRRLQALDTALGESVLESRLGLLPHFDPLARTSREIEYVHVEIARVPAFVPLQDRRELARATRASLEAARARAARVEGFMTAFAALRNSVRCLPIVADDLAARLRAQPAGEDLARQLDGLRAQILLYNVVPAREVQPAIEASLAQLRAAREQAAALGLGDALELVLRHAQVVIERRPLVDAIVSQVLARTTGAAVARIDAAYARGYHAALAASAMRAARLFGLALVLVASASALTMSRMRRSTRALARAHDALATANGQLVVERQKEKEVAALRSRIVSMASHEFRTPLSVILSSSELLEAYGERWPTEKKQTHYVRIRAAVGAMAQLLDDILVSGKAEAGLLSFAPRALDLAGFCDALVKDFRQADAGAHAVAYRIEPRPGKDRTTHMDDKLLRHVLTNLLSNATKYSPRGSEVRLDVSWLDGGERVRFAVQDHGIGVPDEDRARLFESFHRGGNVGAIPGTGLGLAIVKHAVDLQGGTIAVDSVVGAGACFVVTLPAGAAS